MTAGTVRYEYSYVPNPKYSRRTVDLYSTEFRKRLRAENTPSYRLIRFDGRRSRAEEINVDYGIRGPSLEFRVAGQEQTIYCKRLGALAFRVEYPVGRPVTEAPPQLQPSNEFASIAGLRCRLGEYLGRQHLRVWYSEQITLDDPTGAVLTLPGVPGVVLRTEEISTSPTLDMVRRTTVTELSLAPPPHDIFTVPAHYRPFRSVDEARAADRRELQERADAELRARPLTQAEREMFLGEWWLRGRADIIQVQIGPEVFRSTVLSAPPGVPGRIEVAPARPLGRRLLVDDPPGYRLYRITADRGNLVQVGSEVFRFTRR